MITVIWLQAFIHLLDLRKVAGAWVAVDVVEEAPALITPGFKWRVAVLSEVASVFEALIYLLDWEVGVFEPVFVDVVASAASSWDVVWSVGKATLRPSLRSLAWVWQQRRLPALGTWLARLSSPNTAALTSHLRSRLDLTMNKPCSQVRDLCIL